MNYSIISKYRGHLMGVATLWIALLHASMWFPIEPINWIKLTGQGGVDIFLFLSAFGLYYSYKNDNNKISFWKKRFIRIFPIFIPLALLRWYYNDYSFDQGLMMISTTLFWLTGDRSTWYISAIIPLYLITPFYLKSFDTRPRIYTMVAIIASLVLSVFFFSGPYIVFFARIPVFFLGFYAGYLAYNKKIITKKAWLFQILLFIIGFGMLRYVFLYTNETILWNYGLYWFPMLFASWPFCLLCSVLFAKLDDYHIPVITSALKKIGVVTLEFYLLHDLMIKFFTNILTINPMYSAYGIVLNILVIFATYYTALYYHDAMNWLMKQMKNYFKKIWLFLLIICVCLSGVIIYKSFSNKSINLASNEIVSDGMNFEVQVIKNSSELKEFIANYPDITFKTSKVNSVPVLEAYIDDGNKKPLVFFLHGLNGNKESFAYLLSIFAQNGYHAVAFDAASHGMRNDGSHYFYEIIVQTGYDCEMLLTYFSQDSEVDVSKYGVVGFSMGGMSAYWLVANGKYKPAIIAPIASTPNYLDVQNLYLTDTVVENGLSGTDESRHDDMIEILSINNPSNNIEAFNNVYTIICHGKNDILISYSFDELFYQELKDRGYMSELYLYDCGHVIPSEFVPTLVQDFTILQE